MLNKMFRNRLDFNIYHFTGEILKSKHVFNKIMVFDEKLSPRILKKKSLYSYNTMIEYFINITDIKEDDKYYLIKLTFQKPLDIG